MYPALLRNKFSFVHFVHCASQQTTSKFQKEKKIAPLLPAPHGVDFNEERISDTIFAFSPVFTHFVGGRRMRSLSHRKMNRGNEKEREIESPCYIEPSMRHSGLLFTVAEAGNRNHVMDGYSGVMPGTRRGRAEPRPRWKHEIQLSPCETLH